jgi:hypothetical protein
MTYIDDFVGDSTFGDTEADALVKMLCLRCPQLKVKRGICGMYDFGVDYLFYITGRDMPWFVDVKCNRDRYAESGNLVVERTNTRRNGWFDDSFKETTHWLIWTPKTKVLWRLPVKVFREWFLKYADAKLNRLVREENGQSYQLLPENLLIESQESIKDKTGEDYKCIRLQL